MWDKLFLPIAAVLLLLTLCVCALFSWWLVCATFDAADWTCPSDNTTAFVTVLGGIAAVILVACGLVIVTRAHSKPAAASHGIGS